MRYLPLLFVVSTFFSCKSPKEAPSLGTASLTEIGVTFLDSIPASKQILTDGYDGFFEAISVVDMAIQLRTEARYDDRSTALADYKALLQSEVSDWTAAERKLMDTVMTSCRDLITKANPLLWPSHIDLIKIKTNHYGPDVYYTREDAILIPENAIERGDVDELTTVMLHEIYHILSRLDPSFRKATYALIDFKPHNKKLSFVNSILNRRLTNPDGVNMDYAITLDNGKNRPELALPILISQKPYFSKNLPSFFSYLKFDLYMMRPISGDNYVVDADGKGASTLSPEHQNDYFSHIADNTQYVIHPDEVMADNFMLTIKSNASEDFSQFSATGLPLIKNLLSYLESYKP